MINEFKEIINNYLNNAKLCNFVIGTVTADGIRISEKLIIPNELTVGNLKSKLMLNQRVRLLRNHGGQQYFILEVLD